jgi:hypothetical protein
MEGNAVNVGRIFFIIALTIVLSSPVVHASAPGAAPQSLPPSHAAADTTKARKERVRKETPPPAPKEQLQHEAEVSDDESDFWGDCLGSLLGSLCGSLFGGDNDQNQPSVQPVVEQHPPSTTQIGEALSGPMKELPFTGIIEPMYGGGPEVGLYDRPGGEKANADTIELLQEGTRVKAVKYGLFEENRWLLVSRLEPGAPEGWVLEKEVFLRTAPGEMGAGAAPTAMAPSAGSGQVFEPTTRQESLFPQKPLWQIGATASLPVFSQKAVQEEYKNKGYQVGVEGGFYLPHSLKLHLFIDYLHANGTPLYDYYVGGEIKDSPLENDLEILSIGLPIGQSFPFAAGLGFFSYGLGPALFRVHEHALIREYEGGQPAGARIDRLATWKVGGEAVVAVGGVLGGRVPLSLETRFSFIPWSAAEEKSLTLDFLGTEDIGFFTFGIGIGFSSF